MAATLTIDLGESAILTTTFSVAAVNTDPTAVSLELKSPGGTVTTFTYAGGAVTKSATGVYTKTLATSILNAAGTWRYSWIGTGTAEGVDQGDIVVKQRASA